MPHTNETAITEITATREDTLVLAHTTAAILKLASCKPKNFKQSFTEPIIEDRKHWLTRSVRQVQVGTRTSSEVIARGWELSRTLTDTSEHHSNYDLLVLKASGALAVIGYTSTFLSGSGYGKRWEMSANNAWPALGIANRVHGYEDPTSQETFVQQKLTSLVTQQGLHQGTMFEQVFQQIADQTK